jgi:hypothetical protein
MFNLKSNSILRRGVGIFSVFVILAIGFVLVPDAVASSRSDRGASRDGGETNSDRISGDNDSIGGVPGDGDAVGGARVKFHSDTTESGECGGGNSFSYVGNSSSPVGVDVNSVTLYIKCLKHLILFR